MSKTLLVTLDGRQFTALDEADLQDLFRTAAKAIVPPSIAFSIRLVLRREPYGASVEPFVGSASFEALLGIAKKRDDAIALLTTLVACGFSFCDRVGVLLIEEGQPIPQERTDLPFAALRQRRRFDTGWNRIIAPIMWFHFSQVEARLLQPLKLSTGQLATHYFRDFWVRAIEHQIAAAAVEITITKDAATVAAFGELERGEPTSEARR
jgi:hypothetical protein